MNQVPFRWPCSDIINHITYHHPNLPAYTCMFIAIFLKSWTHHHSCKEGQPYTMLVHSTWKLELLGSGPTIYIKHTLISKSLSVYFGTWFVFILMDPPPNSFTFWDWFFPNMDMKFYFFQMSWISMLGTPLVSFSIPVPVSVFVLGSPSSFTHYKLSPLY